MILLTSKFVLVSLFSGTFLFQTRTGFGDDLFKPHLFTNVCLCEPGRARFGETNKEFSSQVFSRNHSIIFFSANLALQVRFSNLTRVQ